MSAFRFFNSLVISVVKCEFTVIVHSYILCKLSFLSQQDFDSVAYVEMKHEVNVSVGGWS